MDGHLNLVGDPATLSTLGKFSGRVAHEFNNLLTPLLAYPDILRSVMDPADQDSQELVTMMATAATELARMTRQMTQLSLGDSTSGDSNFAVADAWKIAKDALENEFGDLGDRVLVGIPAGLPTAKGRADTACHAIESIVRNAIEASPAGRPVMVKADLNEWAAGRTLFGRETPAWKAVVVSVEDAGSGIPPAIRQTLFEPFVTSKKVEGKRRLGVGLTITHRVMRALNGDIVFDVPAGGTGTAVRLAFAAT